MNKITLSHDLALLVEQGRGKIERRKANDQKRREGIERKNREEWEKLLGRIRDILPEPVRPYVAIIDADGKAVGLGETPTIPIGTKLKHDHPVPCMIILADTVKPIRFAVDVSVDRSWPRVVDSIFVVGDDSFKTLAEALAYTLDVSRVSVEYINASEPA